MVNKVYLLTLNATPAVPLYVDATVMGYYADTEKGATSVLFTIEEVGDCFAGRCSSVASLKLIWCDLQ